MNQFARSNTMTDEQHDTMKYETRLMRGNGYDMAAALRVVEIKCGKLNVEFEPEGREMVEGVYRGVTVVDAVVAPVVAEVEAAEEAAIEAEDDAIEPIDATGAIDATPEDVSAEVVEDVGGQEPKAHSHPHPHAGKKKAVKH